MKDKNEQCGGLRDERKWAFSRVSDGLGETRPGVDWSLKEG